MFALRICWLVGLYVFATEEVIWFDSGSSESRYLLILTENYAALGLLQHELLQIKDAIIIFGSSFPKDQEYTQVG